ncbi:MAG: presenilin family intramembrane aspartyl protease, partial [Candidatus Altiarchaeota archaeon]|nr:presenilin family intramembrane aspartyl protease [Candidatus Altiarchaeota archaeon]
ILTVVGAGALLGASLSIIPSIILLIILSIYDLIAVFWTKHMVTLAENAKGKLPFMFIIPHKGKTVGLGTGDLAIPLVFTASVLKDYTLASALATSAGGLIGLLTLFLYIQKRKRITLPALPPLAIGLIAGFTASLIPTLL